MGLNTPIRKFSTLSIPLLGPHTTLTFGLYGSLPPAPDLQVEGDGVDDAEGGVLLPAQHTGEHLRVIQVTGQRPFLGDR